MANETDKSIGYNKKHMDNWGFVLGKTKCYLCGKILTYNNATVQLGTWVHEKVLDCENEDS